MLGEVCIVGVAVWTDETVSAEVNVIDEDCPKYDARPFPERKSMTATAMEKPIFWNVDMDLRYGFKMISSSACSSS